jgi:hypothetical protein
VVSRRIEVPGGRLPGWIDRFANRHGGVSASATDALVRLDAHDGSWAEIEVPWPPLPSGSGDPVEALLGHVAAPRRLALLLVRKGGFAVGVLDPEGLTRTKVGSRHVQGRTKAGGWSQQRYARRRAQQSRAAYGAAADVAATILLPVVDTIDGLVPGGDRQAVAAVLDDKRLHPVRDLPRGRFLSVPEPRRAVLDRAAEDCLVVVVRVADATR